MTVGRRPPNWDHVRLALVHVPYALRRKLHGESTMADDSFDVLQRRLGEVDLAITRLALSAALLRDAIEAVVASLAAVASATSGMLSPLAGETGLDHHASVYGCGMTQTLPELSRAAATWFRTVETTAQTLAGFTKAAKRRCRRRNDALMDYDRFHAVYTQRQAQHTTQLSATQHQQMVTAERRMDYHRVRFDSANSELKRELPVFFALVAQAVEPLVAHAVLVTLTTVFHIHGTARAMAREVGIAPSPSYASIVYEWESKVAEAAAAVKALGITSFHTTFLRALAQRDVWVAEFAFTAQQEGDVSLVPGDVITVHSRSGGWWEGEVNGVVGRFPGNYVKPQPDW